MPLLHARTASTNDFQFLIGYRIQLQAGSACNGNEQRETRANISISYTIHPLHLYNLSATSHILHIPQNSITFHAPSIVRCSVVS